MSDYNMPHLYAALNTLFVRWGKVLALPEIEYCAVKTNSTRNGDAV